MKKFIAIAGNIGVGKSTLVGLLCERLGMQPFYEPVIENPYLVDFYQNMSSWSFQSQIFFSRTVYRIQKEILHFPGSVIQDRSIYEDAEIFARNLFLQGNMSERDYNTYHTLYETISDFLPAPNLVIYLRSTVSTLISRITKRDRVYERTMEPEYLENLNQLYEDWIHNFTVCPVLTVPADDLDYVRNSPHLDLIVEKVEAKLTGKDEVSFSSSDLLKAKQGI